MHVNSSAVNYTVFYHRLLRDRTLAENAVRESSREGSSPSYAGCRHHLIPIHNDHCPFDLSIVVTNWNSAIILGGRSVKSTFAHMTELCILSISGWEKCH